MFRDIDADCYLMVDGDDTYPAAAAKALCEPILAKQADMVVGDRLSNGTYAQQNARAFHGFGNDLVRFMIKWIYGYAYPDVMTGYRAMSKSFIKTFPVLSEGFQIETEAINNQMQLANRLLQAFDGILFQPQLAYTGIKMAEIAPERKARNILEAMWLLVRNHPGYYLLPTV